MSWRPKFPYLIKILFRRRDTNAAQGLFLEGKLEYDNGNADDAELMFYYGTKLDPDFAGNFYNYAVAIEKKDGPTMKARSAWKSYLEVAKRDKQQTQESRRAVEQHLEKMK